MKALVSIHDVMPQSLERVDRILDWLKARSVPPVTLLVVPGRAWGTRQIEHLSQLAAGGHELAAHGWYHETRPRRFYHRLHAALISRKVAEHLDLDSPGILQLMQRSSDWFGANGLPTPDFYVPPAWSLGPISKTDLSKVPFRLIETTRGLIHRQPCRPEQQSCPPAPTQAGTGKRKIGLRSENESGLVRFQKLPLTGYEADTPLREYFLRRWNAAQARAADRKDLPLRISIHPDDLDLRLADQMAEQIQSVRKHLSYRSLKESAQTIQYRTSSNP